MAITTCVVVTLALIFAQHIVHEHVAIDIPLFSWSVRGKYTEDGDRLGVVDSMTIQPGQCRPGGRVIQ